MKFFFFLQGKTPKEIHAILTETLACFLPGRAKDLPAHLYLSVHKRQLSSHWMEYRDIWYFSIFRKSLEKIQILLKYEENNGRIACEDVGAFLIEPRLMWPAT